MTRDEYIERRRKIDADKVELGHGGLWLHEPDAHDKGQEGYAGVEDWSGDWLKIGQDLDGDPVILDLASGKVMSAQHGQGSWSPDFMAVVKENEPGLDPWWWLMHLYGGEDPPADGRAGT